MKMKFNSVQETRSSDETWGTSTRFLESLDQQIQKNRRLLDTLVALLALASVFGIVKVLMTASPLDLQRFLPF